jgi:hypothetical protein
MVVYLVACYQRNLVGEKEVLVFENFPDARQLQQAAELELKRLDYTDMDRQLSNARQTLDRIGTPAFIAWDAGPHKLTIQRHRLIRN